MKYNKNSPLIINEEYYKTNEDFTSKGGGGAGGANSTKSKFVYELIPMDNFEKNNKKLFASKGEVNLIENYRIEEILKNEKIPIQEKVKNFDIHYENKMDDFRTLKLENEHFNAQFQKFYKNGEIVEFEPFKSKNETKDEINKILERKIFDEIILAYENKNYKIPDFIKKNIFEHSPLLIDLSHIREFYNIPKRLEDPKFLKGIKKMMNINSFLSFANNVNLQKFAMFCESDFELHSQQPGDLKNAELQKIKQESESNTRSNVKLKEYVKLQAEKLENILSENKFLKEWQMQLNMQTTHIHSHDQKSNMSFFL